MLIECVLDSFTETGHEVILRGRFAHGEVPAQGIDTSLLLGEGNKLVGVVIETPTGTRFAAMRGAHEDVRAQVPHPMRVTVHDGQLQIAIPRSRQFT